MEDEDEEDDYGDEAEGMKRLQDEGEEFDQFKDEMGDEADAADYEKEDEIFNKARHEDEMDLKKYQQDDYANKEMLGRIEKIEEQMISNKSWHVMGEIQAKERPLNSLLEVHLDFNVASKLPPQITQEKTNGIEGIIKQRVMDELFDDPVRKYIKGKKAGDDDDNQFDFTKAKKGLGEQYEDDYRKKLLASSDDPNSFLRGNDILSGVDSSLKKEINELMRGLFSQLDQLSNFSFVPRVSNIKEATISTQNVPAMMIEEALPIGVS